MKSTHVMAKCIYCAHYFHWKKTSGGHWRLYNDQGKVHSCQARNQRAYFFRLRHKPLDGPGEELKRAVL